MSVLLGLDVRCEELLELLGPDIAPGERALERVLDALLRVDRMRVDGETGGLAGKACGLLGEAQVIAEQVEQIRGVATVEQRESRVEVQRVGVKPQ